MGVAVSVFKKDIMTMLKKLLLKERRKTKDALKDLSTKFIEFFQDVYLPLKISPSMEIRKQGEAEKSICP